MNFKTKNASDQNASKMSQGEQNVDVHMARAKRSGKVADEIKCELNCDAILLAEHPAVTGQNFS